jgi:septum formation protein
MAIEKAQKAWNNSDKKVAVLGADTIIAFAGKILGKPRDQQQAHEMLMALSDHSHQVITSIAMINTEKQKTAESISTVKFIKLSDQTVKNYVQTNEPMDKAGSYAIQGQAAQWISHISGSYSGIMGLPLCETAQLIQEFT